MRPIILLLLAAGFLGAQSPTAALVGRIEDPTGAAVAGVSVQIRNINTGESRTVRTELDGEFTAPNLPPGEYEVIVEKAGFHRVHRTGVELEVDQTARLDFRLEVGAVAESVEVRAEAPMLNTENAVRGEVIAGEEMVEMPLNGRDFADLSYLVPGVLRKAQGGQGAAMAINGARADNTNFLVDGFNDQNVRGGAAQARPPLDSLAEYKMQTTGFSAEYGRLAGGVMNMVLKTGGNQFHGAVFEFLRNDKLDARNFFDADKSKLRRNQFGATLTGPVTVPRIYRGRDRTFFVASWESYRQVLGNSRLARVPTELERQGDFSQTRDQAGKVIQLRDPLASGACDAKDQTGCFPGNVIPASRFHPAAAKIAQYYPLPNRTGQVNNYLAGANDQDTWDSFLGKIDHRLAEKDNLSFRYMRRHNDTTDPFAGSAIGTFPNKTDEAQSLGGITWIRLFSPVFINEFRTGFTRTAHKERGAHLGENLAGEFGISGTTTDPALVGFPRFTIRDLANLGDGNDTPIRFVVTNLQWADTVTLVHSRHTIRAGADILRSQFSQPANANFRGTFNFLGRWTNVPFADFLLGLLNNTSRKVGTVTSYLFSTTYGFFVQDDFRARSNLTLNLGLRYEIVKPPLEKYGRLANFVPELGKVIIADDQGVPDLGVKVADAGLGDGLGVARDFGLRRSLVYTPYKNFAPRFGFAWRPFGGTRMSVRGGYGIFWGGSVLNPIRTDLANTFPFSVSQSYTRNASQVNKLTLSTPFPGAGTLDGVTNTAGYQLHPPGQYVQSWNLTIEREIGRGTVLETGYVGSKGTHLGRRYNINQPFRVPELRLSNGNFPKPFQNLNTIDYYSFASNSIYNAGILSIRKRFSSRFFYRISYIYSKSIDDASQITGASDGGYGGLQDARNRHGERGRSDWDTGHTVTMNYSYELPLGQGRLRKGWQIAGTGRMYTGQPFTPQTSNAQLDQGEANRPDRIAKGRLDVRTPERWFDLSAFPALPLGAYRFGNSGRNVLDGPGFVEVNVSLIKRLPVRDRGDAQIRVEAFNVSNHTNFMLPNDSVNATNGGTITQAHPSRVVQVGLRYQF